MSGAALSRAADTDPSFVSRLRSGQRTSMGYAGAVRIERALSVPYGTLFDYVPMAPEGEPYGHGDTAAGPRASIERGDEQHEQRRGAAS